MKEIKAFVHKQRIGAVIEALKAASPAGRPGGGARNINVVSVQSLLPAIDSREQHYSTELGEPVIQQCKLELLCEDGDAERFAGIISGAARTGQEEAGWVCVMPVELALQIGAR
jgi:nitrogen regulatory protein P-II 1